METGRIDSTLTDAFRHFAASPCTGRWLLGLEVSLDALYAQVANEDQGGIQKLEELLVVHAGRHPAIDAWLALTRTRLAQPGYPRATALEAVARVLGEAPARTRVLVGAEAARLVYDWEGAANARKWLTTQRLDEVLTAVSPDVELDRARSPIGEAVCSSLAIAALSGEWEAHDRIAASVTSMWPEDHPSAVRVAARIADSAIARGRYLEALQRLRAVETAARGDLRVHVLCAELHALLALGKGSDDSAASTCRALLDALEEAPAQGDDLPDDERCALHARAERLIAMTPVLRDVAEERGFHRPAAGAAEHQVAGRLPLLLEREQRARSRKKKSARDKELGEVLDDVEDLMAHQRATRHPEGWARLRLLWCRLVVDLGQHQAFEVCERMLAEIIEDARQLQSKPLEMLAHDQRAILRSRMSPARWKEALVDSSVAVQIVVEQLQANALAAGSDRGTERSLLESLLPVLDRVIELYAEGAVRVAQRHPELRDRPLGRTDARSLTEESPRGTWLRFGRVLHAYAEQTQVLALDEARQAYGGDGAGPSRFVPARQGEPAIILDRLRRALRREDGVVQYLVVSRYVIVFVYGRAFFDWYIETVEHGSAEEVIEQLTHQLRGWIQGGSELEHAEGIARLEALLFPKKIVAALEWAGVRHLRIVPHAMLYRVPFGKLDFSGAPLSRRFSLSLHPTGTLAAESASRKHVAPSRRPSLLGYVIGPENEATAGGARSAGAGVQADTPLRPVACAEREEQAIRRGAGAIWPAIDVQRIDGVASTLVDLLAQMGQCALIHVTCHGREGGAHDQQPMMRLGRDEHVGLEPGALIANSLQQCALVFLQSCSTGWMEHRRTNPVQGFPQAFCDAGARAVIAPLLKVPQALAPIFSSVFYRALRFLPAEKALQRALSVLRAHGATLVAGDPEAQEAWYDHGASMDRFEYRYTGATGIAIGGPLSRLVGRLSFAWFVWLLRRAERASPRRELLTGLLDEIATVATPGHLGDGSRHAAP